MSESETTTWPPAVTWDDIPGETARGGVHRRGFGTENVLLVMHDLAPDMDLSPHSHEFDQIAVIVEGDAIYHVGDRRNRVGPGSVLLIPAGVEHYIEPTSSTPVKNLDVFAPCREDYKHLIEWMRPPA
ncbi:MAG TPA: cupin domain-containing protein [Gaiellales bacterium]|nr:cupin domain-containing protein [Gaiellales bacterium]